VEDSCQLDLAFAPGSAGRTQLIRRHIAYPYHAAAPVPDAAGVSRLVLQSVSGGLYGGERLVQHIRVEAGARAAILQPAATVVRRMAEGNGARQTIRLTVAAGAQLAYLARPIILFPGSSLEQDIAVSIAPGGRLLLRDGFLDHQPGSRGRDWRFASRVTLRSPDGRLLAAERMTLGRAVFDSSRPGVAGIHRAFGKLWLLGATNKERTDLPPRIQADWPSEGAVYAAASALPGDCGLVIALAAVDGGALDAAIDRMTTLLLSDGVTL
jgi:urease accessory protein